MKVVSSGQRRQKRPRSTLNAEQERYVMREMEKLELFLFRAGVPGRHITIATIYLSNDLESLLLELDIRATVEYASFIEFVRDQEAQP